MEEDEVGLTNFIPCICFIPRGVAKANPEKVTLEQSELARIIQETQNDLAEVELREMGGDDDDDDAMATSDNEQEETAAVNSVQNDNPNFQFEDYDQEVGGPAMALGNIAVIDTDEQLQDEDEDSEAEDDIIKPRDNLILAGHVEEDCSSLEVYVYNEDEESLYVHHDFLLPAFPLCIEWMNHDAGNDEEGGNMCAIGSMNPTITVWDLDIQDSLEPIQRLGKKGKQKHGHTDAVLDLSWNRNFGHVLASASVDQTVIFWDLDEGIPHTRITSFEEKVQCLKFQPNEAKSLLTGCCDGVVRLFDCRALDEINTSFKQWSMGGEIERVCWNNADLNYFAASTNSGQVFYCDIRMDEPVWTHQCHEEETSGLVISPHIPGMLTTTSSDGLLKVWDFNATEINLVYTQAMKIGKIQCLAVSPENSLTVAVGGDNRKKHFKVVELNHEVIVNRFGSRPKIAFNPMAASN